MPPRELEARKILLADMDCPLCWSGSDEEYRAAWGLPPEPSAEEGGRA